MKKALIVCLFVYSSISFSATLSKTKINGPECTAHIVEELKIAPEEAYQICSNHKEETKVCLLKNLKLSKKELLKKCHSK